MGLAIVALGRGISLDRNSLNNGFWVVSFLFDLVENTWPYWATGVDWGTSVSSQ